MTRSRFIAFAAAFVLATPAVADIKPHALFGNSMVFQRNAPLPVWGNAEPGEEVYVHLEVKTSDGKREEGQAVKADKDGKWMARLAAFPAGTDGVLTIRGQDRRAAAKEKKAPNAVVFKDVAVGEVWVASGQSNMEWRLEWIPKGGGLDAIKNSSNPNLRVFTVPKYAVPSPQAGFNPLPPKDKYSDKLSMWLTSQPENAPIFSAVGYYFGRDLQKALQVPVGIIHTSWGGTPAQAWTSSEALDADQTVKYYVEELAKRKQNWNPNQAKEEYERALAKWKAAAEEAKAAGRKEPQQPRMPAEPGTGSHDPSSLYNGMIAPLLPYAIKGAIWYQGESNAGKPIEYRTLYAAMISDWRKRWGSDFPFYCVQLAPFNAGNPNGDNWAFLREAQAIASEKVKNAGVAVITDAGDLGDIHPQRKEPAGARLAYMALANTYGQKIEFSGPKYKSMKVDGSKAVLSFDHVGDGLAVGQFAMAGADNVGNDGKIVGFAVAGEDKVFHPATAFIEGETVVITSDKVSKPVAVRYGWKNFPVCNLFNKAGLPASPFRTDDWTPPTLK
jgi:sialate O-acetylesterase